MNTATAETCKAKAFTESVRAALNYKVTFVPQSQSRNAGEKLRTVNWLITLGEITKPGFMRLEYQSGIGNVPGLQGTYGAKRTLESSHREHAASEQGKYYRKQDTNLFFALPLPAPELVDVLYCLVMDSNVLDCDGFEDWADEYGYDTDSRAAKKAYKKCLSQSRKLRKLIDLDAAREAFQDY